MTKNMMLKALSDYMASKGVDTVSLADYKADDKAPVEDYLLEESLVHGIELLRAAKYRFPVKCTCSCTTPKKAVKEKVVEADDKWRRFFIGLTVSKLRRR